MPDKRVFKPRDTMQGDTFAEQFFSQVSDSIQLVFDLTSRIDERVKTLIERQSEMEVRLDKLLETQAALISRVTTLEARDSSSSIIKDLGDVEKRVQETQIRMEALTIKNQGHEAKWKTMIDLGLKLLIALIGGALLASLHFPSPPVIGP